ncbi:hypothetical protein ACFVW8_10800 [Streptomyces sp. NPDC058221]|uniref:hypothetical protein n=1 Tax=Streptomyces sp. NPDC058221 TaxID=3346388 RepID=UPI0036E3D29C
MNSSQRIRQGVRTSTGQSAIEYLAMLGVVVAVVGAIVAVTIGGDITSSAHVQICRIAATTGGGGECADDNAVDDTGDDDSHPDEPTESVEPASAPDNGDDSGGVPGGKPDDGSTEKPSDSKGNALPSLCFEPRERSSNSKVSVPGNGPTSTAAAWGYSYLVNFIIDKVNNEKNKEKRVKAALDDLSYCLPDYNIVIAQPHEGNLQQMDGAAMISTVEISGTTYRVYAFKTGKFTWDDDADLGWKNRAFKGYYDISDDRRTVTFDNPPRPKRKKDWKPGDEGCQIEGEEPPDRSRYYNTYSPLDNEGSAQAVRMLVNDMRRCYPDYNVVAMHSEQSSHWIDKPDSFINQSRYRLNSNEYTEDEEGNNIASGRAVFDVYVFDKGKFSNDGDGGYINWAYYGDATRDDKVATFDKPEPADLDADSTSTGSESVNFNDGAPKYTEGTYPGTDYSGKKPGDDAELNQSLIDEYSRTFPDTNIIATKNFNDLSFSGVSGLEHIAVVDGVDIFSVKNGTVINNGDGGWKNWGFAGTYDREKDSKEVTFKR